MRMAGLRPSSAVAPLRREEKTGGNSIAVPSVTCRQRAASFLQQIYFAITFFNLAFSPHIQPLKEDRF
jgi:hypothetical protein